MRYVPAHLIFVTAACGLLSFGSSASAATDPAGLEFFEKKIRPLLVQHCYACHSARSGKSEGGLRLDTPEAILRGGESGKIFTPGQPTAESPLLEAVSYNGGFVDMPPDGRLPAPLIADLRRWVELGAPLPEPTGQGDAPAPQTTAVIDARTRNFWSFRPVEIRPLPESAGTAWPGQAQWPRRRIDHFIGHQLAARGLQPAPMADRRTLIRRLSYDLTGLPPTWEEVEAFVADRSPTAWEQLTERLLASPRYGERWGRHWLDVARYAEDNPTNESTCKPPRFPHPYRDWVIRSLNEDLPYDEFVRRQLAADLMDGLPPEELAATGFLGLSPVYHKEPKLSADVIATIVADEWDERIDTMTRGFLGLTVACARCHDHKFDPIRTEDYYSLAGVMASTRLVEWPLARVPAETAKQLQDTNEAIVDVTLRLSYAKIMQKTAKEAGEPTEPFQPRVDELEAELKALKERKLFDGPVVNGVQDAGLWIDGSDPAWTTLEFRTGTPRDLPVFLRGNPAKHGEIVPRRFLEVLSPSAPAPFKQGSGRLELASAIVEQSRGLAARVMVNRVWGWHFGQPLVRTPSNFGQLGDRPSHPELLDDLAARFVLHGWSLKWLHREIVLSATWRQSAVHVPAAGETDPQAVDGANRLLWKMNRRRLEPEAWRDAVLLAGGQLDQTMGGQSQALDEKNTRRTVYG
ncbi:MAG: DUF1549 domain-containing protein, partial [Planctomycetaceae bacterium]|nr:DUF1549 domain-containing protein [Planctomycetaceae bacterium]